MIIKVLQDNEEISLDIPDNIFAELIKNSRTGYERVGRNSKYHIALSSGKIHNETERNTAMDNSRYNGGNYYNDESLAENNARADKLMRQLRRYAIEISGGVLQWKNFHEFKYYIGYDHKDNAFTQTAAISDQYFGCIYFYSVEDAQKAIDKFKDELIWYFTEYKNRL